MPERFADPVERFDDAFDAAVRMAIDADPVDNIQKEGSREWRGRYDFALHPDGDLERAQIDWQLYFPVKNDVLVATTGEDAAPLARTSLYRYSVNLRTGEAEEDTFSGPLGDLKNLANPDGREPSYNLTVTALFRRVLDLPLSDEQLAHVVSRYYITRDELYRRKEGGRSQQVLDKAFTSIDQQTGSSQRVTLRTIADTICDSEQRHSNLYELNKLVIERLLGKQTSDGEPYEPSTDFPVFIRAMQEFDLQRVDLYVSPEVMSFPGVAEFLLDENRKGVDVFRTVAEGQRLALANAYVRKVFDTLHYTDGRDSKRIGIIKNALFPDDYKNRIRWNDMIALSNEITDRVNKQRPEEEKQVPLSHVGDVRDLLFLGEAFFRILEITSTSASDTDSNRHYAELLDASLAPLYEKIGQPTYVTEADMRMRYPLSSDQERADLMQAAKDGGYAAASRLYGRAVYYNRYEPGKGIIS